MSVLVIAEAGVNHNGDVGRALAMIDAAAEAGADIVKFQTFRSDALVVRGAKKADYQRAATPADEDQRDMLRKLELDQAAHHALMERCAGRGIEFLSSPFDLESLSFLADTLGVRRLKIPSGEVTNGPFLLRAAHARKPIILSTGMSEITEIRQALSVLAFGYISTAAPSFAAFDAAFESDEGQRALRQQVTMLQCTTEYPAPAAEINLKAMDTLRDLFGLAVGLSDHTLGTSVAIAAAARGAPILEKHFTLDRSLPGPDHRASLEPRELADMINGIRTVEAALGDGRKTATPSELRNRPIARRSLVAARAIRAGALFTEADIDIKRPGTGLSPMHFWQLIGSPAARDYAPDEIIDQ